LADLNFIDDTLLAAIYGGVISGIGAGMIFRVGGSAGGTDTIATIIKNIIRSMLALSVFRSTCS
jgi:Uncharacterized conserved protein